YRQVFHEDVFIDILCYRRYGHNEADEPKFTQPLLYKAIEAHPNPLEIYKQKLQTEGSIDANLATEMEKKFRAELQTRLDESKAEDKFTKTVHMFEGAWQGMHLATTKEFFTPIETAVPEKELLEIGKKLTVLPKGKAFLK